MMIHLPWGWRRRIVLAISSEAAQLSEEKPAFLPFFASLPLACQLGLEALIEHAVRSLHLVCLQL